MMGASIAATVEDVREEKAAAAARASAGKVTVKSEPDCKEPPFAPSLGKKRKLAEGDAKGESWALDLSCPRGFSPTPSKPPTTTGKDTGGWKAARQLLQGIVTPSRECELAASRPSDVVTSSYMSLLQTVNDVAFSLGYAMERLEARERDAEALRAELGRVKAELELAETKAKAAEGYERGMDDMRRVALRRYPHLVVPPRPAGHNN